MRDIRSTSYDFRTGQLLPDTLQDTSGGLEWDATGEHVYYVTLNEANRPFRLYRHRMGDTQDNDQMVFEEPDEGVLYGTFKIVQYPISACNPAKCCIRDGNSHVGR